MVRSTLTLSKILAKSDISLDQRSSENRNDQRPSEGRDQKPQTSSGHIFGPITSEVHVRVAGDIASSSKASSSHEYKGIGGKAGHEIIGDITEQAYREGLAVAKPPWSS